MTSSYSLIVLRGLLIGLGIGTIAGFMLGIYYIKKKTEKQMENSMNEIGNMFNTENLESGIETNE